MGKWLENYVQVYHCRNNHWITVTTVGCKEGEINVYDSLYTTLDSATKTKIEKTFPNSNIDILLPPAQKQDGVKDCGLFALALLHSLLLEIVLRLLTHCYYILIKRSNGHTMYHV